MLPRIRLHIPMKGFSLIQLVIDLAILSILLLFLIILIDPAKQFQKAKDTTRKHDAEQIRNALDIFYNDHICYPQSVPFSLAFEEAETVYMQKVPQDPDCLTNPSRCYAYQAKSSDTCPQWNVIYTKMSKPVDAVGCPLQSFASACLPTNYDATWACTVSGNVDCSYISANPVIFSSPPGSTPGPSPMPSPTSGPPSLPTSTPTSPPGATLTPMPSLTPTPTTICASKNYSCTSGPPARCNVVPEGTGQYCGATCDGFCN